MNANEPRNDGPLVCAFDEPWLDADGNLSADHPKCAAYARELGEQFEAAVARGEFDREGYTPAERRLQQLRRQQQDRQP